MYEKFSQNLTDAIQVLKEADEVITKLLGAVELNPIRIRVVTDLNRIANSIAINTGRPVDVGVAGAGTEVGRVSRFMGKEISKSPVSVTDEVVLKNIPNTAAAELSIRVKDIYPQFTELENDEIRDSLADAEIRGVAKKAGLPVTETTPAKIDSKFIDQIKDAIAAKAKQKELERQGKSGASKENEPTTETALGDDSSKDVTTDLTQKIAPASTNLPDALKTIPPASGVPEVTKEIIPPAAAKVDPVKPVIQTPQTKEVPKVPPATKSGK